MKILLCTLNARYSHASFGLRYLLANLGPLRPLASIKEFIIGQPPLPIVEAILAEEPTLVAFGVYIWNVTEVTQVIELLRALRPDLPVVLGGPEVSHEFEGTPLYQMADHLIAGEGDLAFRSLVLARAEGQVPPKLIDCRDTPPEITKISLPYEEYTDQDLAERLIYVEASRGCPYRCEFCLSALDRGVRAFPLEPLLAAFGKLLDRGARGLKFVDRTFNLHIESAATILRFFLARYRPGLELHFELVPDRLPVELRGLLAHFPPGAVQLEVGIQSLTPPVLRAISRPQKEERIVENLRFLREETGCHVHADLIVGLPGETAKTFAQSLNRLLALAPGEIQIGFLKRLRGAPIARHTAPSRLIFSPRPPYEVLQTGTIAFAEMQALKRMARYFDLYYNSGNFVSAMELLLAQSGDDAYGAFRAFADWLFATHAQTHQLALSRLYQLLFRYLTEVQSCATDQVALLLLADYDRHKIRRERLEFLRPYAPSEAIAPPAKPLGSAHGQKRRGQPAASNF